MARKMPKAILLAGASLMVAYVLNYFVTPNVIGIAKLEVFFRPRGQLKFDSQTWHQAAPSSGKRYTMVDDLLGEGILIGVTMAEVENLLGKPDSTSNTVDGQQLFYFLAEQRRFPAKSIWFPGLFPNHDNWMLEIRTRNGKVEGVNVFFT